MKECQLCRENFRIFATFLPGGEQLVKEDELTEAAPLSVYEDRQMFKHFVT